MLVISDTSPLTALLLAGHELLLLQLFERVVIPPAVERELLRVHSSLPSWIEIIPAKTIPLSIREAALDAGETEAIALALELQPDALLMDERLGRRLAVSHGLTVTGLLGFVVLAKQCHLVPEIVPLVRELQAKGNCWFSQNLLHDVCRSAGETWV